jgi:hypothetical protein
VAEGDGGVVVSLATRPALPVRVAAFGGSDLLDDRRWSLLGQDGQEAWPVEQAKAVDQAGRAVAQHGGSGQAVSAGGVGQGVLGGGRVGAGDPEAVRMVAVAALGRQPATRAAGVEGLRVHDLRHTAGTPATAAGGSLREVMNRLGHSTTVAAVRYQHVMADRDPAIARELNRLIQGG